MGCVSQKSQQSTIYSAGIGCPRVFEIEAIKRVIISDQISELILYLNMGLDVNFTFPELMNRNLIHIAAEAGSLKTIQLLAKRGAELSCKDTFGVTPVGLARLRNDNRTRFLLYELGAEKEFCFQTSKTTEPSPTTPGIRNNLLKRSKTFGFSPSSKM